MPSHNKLLCSLDQKLRNRLDIIKENANEYLKRIIITFPEYTDHGIDHSESILSILESWLLDNEQKDFLLSNPYDIFFLYASAYLHDIGLIEHPYLELPKFVKNNKELKEFIRETHNERSYNLIQKIWKDLGIEDEFQAEIIALICLGHRKIQLTDSRIKDKIPYKSGLLVNVQFLAACIRLADELDLTFERTSYKIFDMIKDKSLLTITKWKQHFSVGGVAPHPYYPATINVRCRCKDPEIHRALKRHEIKIQNMLYDINRNIEPRFLYSRILYDIVNIGYEPIDIKFIVDTSAAIRLFMGGQLYEDKRVFLREIIQNSIDACNIRKCFDPTYRPFIDINIEQHIEKNEVTVIIKDNGIGMDREWIEKYFIPIDLSFYQSGELELLKKKGDISCTFISQFGIGFLSCFNLAKRVIIKTCKPPFTGLKITIFDINGYFDVRTIDHQSQGTEVSIILPKTNWLIEEEFLGYLKSNIRFLATPINFRYKGKNIIIGQELFPYSKEAKSYKTNILSAKLPLILSEGYIAMSFLPDINNASSLGKMIVGISIFQDGIFVVQSDELLPRKAIGFVIGRINLLGKERLPISINRNRVLWGKNDLRRYRYKVEIGIVDITNNMIEINKKDSEDVCKICKTISKFFNVDNLSDKVYYKMNGILQKIISNEFLNNLDYDIIDYLERIIYNSHMKISAADIRRLLEGKPQIGKSIDIPFNIINELVFPSQWQINLILDVLKKKIKARWSEK